MKFVRKIWFWSLQYSSIIFKNLKYVVRKVYFSSMVSIAVLIIIVCFSLLILLIFRCAFMSICRYMRIIAWHISWMQATKTLRVGCASYNVRVIWANRIYSCSSTMVVFTIGLSKTFTPVRNCWCGTTINIPIIWAFLSICVICPATPCTVGVS